MLLCLSTVFGSASCCSAGRASPDNTTAADAREWYTVSLFSLKQGHSIGPSRFSLLENNLFAFEITEERLMHPDGTYTVQGLFFEATARFSVHRTRVYRYVLTFEGFILPGRYAAGLARLKEHDEETRLIQEVPFLFFASKTAGERTEKDLPFF